MKLEEAIQNLKEVKNYWEKDNNIIGAETIETVLQALDNSIPKEVIENKIEDYKERMRYYEDEGIIVDEEYCRYESKVEILQDLLKGE